MPKLEKYTIVIDGRVHGYIMNGNSKVYFEICDVDTWEAMDNKQAGSLALECFLESGIIDWGY